ncbi:MAG TPA: hypothetical protein VI752_00535 [Candidatus Paceibacterota bacterium]
MGRFLIYIITFIVGLVTVALSVMAYHNFWFWKLAYLDIAIHFLAGMTVAFLGLIFYFSVVTPRYLRLHFSFSSVLVTALVATLAVGLIWELFEFSMDEFWSAELSVKQLAIMKFTANDSLSDLLFDGLGALLASLAFWFNWKQKDLIGQSPSISEINNSNI